MMRSIVPKDTPALMAIAEAIGLFEPSQLEEIAALLADYWRNVDETDHFWIVDEDIDHEILGVAYCAPERMTDRTWNLLFLAVHPNHQGKGRGGALVRYVEQNLIAQKARLLLIETASVLDRARAFYIKCGYEEEACIRDFYAPGYDKIVYRKVLLSEVSTLKS